MRYHPRIGYTYMPSTKLRVQGVNGGYLVRTNSTGFRSEREFTQERVPGTFRALLFGDSQTAGDGMANSLRYSELLEKAVPGLEIYNYALYKLSWCDYNVQEYAEGIKKHFKSLEPWKAVSELVWNGFDDR